MAVLRRRGRPPHPDVLTPAEWRIAHLVRHGAGNRRIARALGVSLDAVKYHVGNAVGKLGLGDRAELRRWRGAPRDSALTRTQEERVMADVQLGRIGQVSREVQDLDRAVAWFRDVLRLPLLGHYGTLALFDMDGVRLLLSRPETGSTSGTSIIYFAVPDIHGAFATLSGRGIAFRGAPHLIHRHPDGTEEWMAFFDDMEGRPLALMSQVRA